MIHNKKKEIELKNIFLVIKRRLWIIIVMTILCTSAGFAYSETIKATPTPLYEASTRLIIREDSNLINTLLVFIKEPPVLERVITELDLPLSSEALSNQINIQSVEESQIIKVSVQDSNHERAVQMVNTLSDVYQKEAASTLNFENISILSEAQVVENPIPINPPTNSNRLVQISFIIGLVSSIGFVFLLDSLDNKIRSEQELEMLLEAPVIGTVSKMNKRTLGKEIERKREIVKGEVFYEEKEKRTYI